jgi:hypothetical protein
LKKSPKQEIKCLGKRFLNNSTVSLAVWAVALSCWSQISFLFVSNFHSSSTKKFL